MRKLIVNTFLTLDGVMQAPGGPDEDPAGGFVHGGWSVDYWDDMMGALMGRMMEAPFDLVLGRRTYEIFAAHWPHAGDSIARGDDGGLDAAALSAVARMNGAVKHVASRTLDRVTWQNSHLIVGDLVAAVARLKEQEGPELQVHGSGNLLQTLLPSGLIDELRLWVFPVVVGRGKRLFGDGALPSAFTLAESHASTTGVSIGFYRPSGPLRKGSFALVEPTEAEIERRRKLARED